MLKLNYAENLQIRRAILLRISMEAEIRKVHLTDLLFYITIPLLSIVSQYVIHVVALLASFQGSLFSPMARISSAIFILILATGNGILFAPFILWARAKRSTIRRAYLNVVFWWIASVVLLWTRIVRVF